MVCFFLGGLATGFIGFVTLCVPLQIIGLVKCKTLGLTAKR